MKPQMSKNFLSANHYDLTVFAFQAICNSHLHLEHLADAFTFVQSNLQ